MSACLSALAFVVCHLTGNSLWLGFPLGFVLHVPLLLGVLHPRPSWVCSTISRGPPDESRRIALTFDDGPSPAVTPRVAEILADRGIVATFFCIGRAARGHPDILRALARAGHELGNHSYSHPRHVYLWSDRDLLREIELTQRVVERATGARPRLYRPPVGFRSIAMARAMRRSGLRLVNFNARAFDRFNVRADLIVRRIVRRVRPGAIILLHDGHDRDDGYDHGPMLAALPRILDDLQAGGYRFVSASELLSAPAYRLEPAHRLEPADHH